MQSRDLLMGLVHIPMYDYWWGLTAQEVELLAIDQPLVVYDHHRKNDRNKGKREFGTPSASAMQKAKERWEKMKAEREKNNLEGKLQDTAKELHNTMEVGIENSTKTTKKEG